MTDTVVDVPGVGQVAFPAGMSDVQIEHAIKTNILPQSGAQQRGKAQGEASGVVPWLDNVVRHVANGATFGFADEIAAALDSLTGRRGSYDESLTEGRAQDKAFAAKNPIASTTANIAGNVGSAVATLPAAVTAAGPSLIGNAAKFAGVGGAMGGLQGFGEGEGGFAERAAHAVPSAAFGAAGGAAAPFLGAAGQKIMETGLGRKVAEKMISPAARAIADLLEGAAPAKSLSAAAPDGAQGAPGFFGQIAESTRNVSQEGARDRLATALQRSGMSPESVGRRLDQLGPEGMLADTNQQFLSEARRANTMPGETRDYAKTVLDGRDRQAGNRLVGAFEGKESPPSSYQLGQAFDENARAVGNRAYGAMDEAGLRQSPEMLRLMENPKIDAAWNRVMQEEQQTRIGTSRPPASPVDLMHKIKQEIADMGVAATGRGSSTQQYYRDLAGEFVKAFKAANPAAAEADVAYAQAKSLPEFFDKGRAFLGRGSSEKATDASAPALADLLLGADPQQKLAGRAGMVNAARETALEGTQPARALARRIDESAPVQSKIGELDPTRARDILRQAGTEKTFAETSNEILRGSKTADKLAEMLDTGNAGFRVSPQGVMPRFFERLADIPNMLIKPNEAVRNEIGRLTLRPNAQLNREELQALAAELMKRRQGAPVRAALAGSSGASIGRE